MASKRSSQSAPAGFGRAASRSAFVSSQTNLPPSANEPSFPRFPSALAPVPTSTCSPSNRSTSTISIFSGLSIRMITASSRGCQDDVVVADGVDDLLDSRIVRIGRDIALPLPVVDGVHLQAGNGDAPGSALVAGLKPVQPERHPPRTRLEVDDAQCGVPLQHS